MGVWLLVVAVGAYHGLNPGMGWPLAVSNGLFARRQGAVLAAMLPLAAGHLLAMTAALLPFALLSFYLDWSRTIRICAGLLVVGFGLWRLADPRHPRILARVRPSRLALWSFLMATAHGAGLMLVPIYLGLCERPASGGEAASGLHATVMRLLRSDLGTAVAVVSVHTLATFAAGGAIAWTVYRWFGPKAIGATWFNLDRIWAASLILAGLAGTVTAGLA